MKLTILVVEDDSDIRAVLLDLLTMEGYQVYEADNGATAWKFLEAHTPNILITDIMMPVMDGFELLERISADSRLKNMKLICATASTTISKRLGNACHFCVRKPYDIDYLLSLLTKEVTNEAQPRACS